ncbi:hypothetical protein B0H67DRAFT_474519 [Lasiosphaeris hirsuta]|uniref:Uncharacterized protein n=1 Tax=Lasiosphaeris hirsuta TaxID=260670 RepID=A0AA40BCB4_9PEZI|nr:hypothetical protein B0H67DRAFT_474519 [Lasiosphaeris hirsuta]
MNLRCSSILESEERCQTTGPCGWVAETLEIGIGVVCGVITWRFTVQSESTREFDTQQVAGPQASGLFSHPSPELMLCSCLVFGCCVSSFAHRRQDKDHFQFLIYIIFLAGAVVVGYAFEASANLILLGYLPWAMCAAMAFSLSGHSLYRWQRIGSEYVLGDDSEKFQLLG